MYRKIRCRARAWHLRKIPPSPASRKPPPTSSKAPPARTPTGSADGASRRTGRWAKSWRAGGVPPRRPTDRPPLPRAHFSGGRWIMSAPTQTGVEWSPARGVAARCARIPAKRRASACRSQRTSHLLEVRTLLGNTLSAWHLGDTRLRRSALGGAVSGTRQAP